jgi:anti-anti-sigma regulatory factor
MTSSCTIKDAADFKITLCAYVDSQLPVVVDVGAIERIDTAALQLLCAFVRDRRERGLGVLWQGHSEALSEAVELLDMKRVLALTDAPAAGVAA